MNQTALAFFIIGCLLVLVGVFCWLFLYFYFKKQLKVYEKWKNLLMNTIKKWDWMGPMWINKLIELNNYQVNTAFIKEANEKIYQLNINAYELLNDFRDGIYNAEFGKLAFYKKQLRNMFAYINNIQNQLEELIEKALNNLSQQKTNVNYWQLCDDVNKIEDYNLRLARLLNKKQDWNQYNKLKTLSDKHEYNDQYLIILDQVLNAYKKKLALWHYLWLLYNAKITLNQTAYFANIDLNIKINLLKNKLENLKSYDFNLVDLNTLAVNIDQLWTTIINNKLKSIFINHHAKQIEKIKILKANFIFYLENFLNNHPEFDPNKAWFFKLNQLKNFFQDKNTTLNDIFNFNKMINDFNKKIQSYNVQNYEDNIFEIVKQNYLALITCIEKKAPDLDKLNIWKKANNKLDFMKKYSQEMTLWLISDYKLFIYRYLAQYALDILDKNSEKYLKVQDWLTKQHYLQIFKYLGWK